MKGWGLGVKGPKRAEIWEGVGELRMGVGVLEGSQRGSGSRRELGVREGRGTCLSKNPQHVCNNPKYFFLLHIRNTVVFLTDC